MSWFVPRRATEGLAHSIAASGAGGAYVDGIDDERGFTKVGESRREVPSWTLEKARIYSVHAYRTNPMARAIIDTYTSFCIGDKGLALNVDVPEVEPIARAFWDDPRNDVDGQQEILLRSHLLMGETALEMMVARLSGAVRFSYLDPTGIRRVELDAGNPLWPGRLVFGDPVNERRLEVVQVDDFTGLRGGEAMFWPSWKALASDRRGVPFMSPILDWLQAYDDVLYNLVDRTKLLRYFVWDVTVNGDQNAVDEFIAARGGRHAPPTGSVEVHNESVEWKPQMPQTGAYEDRVTGQSVLTEIAAGSGLAKTWLAEPEDANRATSLTMAEPVRRRVRGVQKMWVDRQTDLVRYAVDQAVAARRIPAEVEVADESGATHMVKASDTVRVTGPEIAASDAKVNSEILMTLSTALTGMVAGELMTPEAAQVLTKRAWEAFAGVPYRPELDKPGDPDATNRVEEYLETAMEAARRSKISAA